MAEDWIILLHDGSPASLVATAMMDRPNRVATLYAHDGCASDAAAHGCFQQQMNHYGIERHYEMALPPWPGRAEGDAGAPPVGRAVAILGAAMQLAERLGGRQIIWPIRAAEHFDHAATWTETTILLRQIHQMVREEPPTIDMPLLEMTDAQLIEVGVQMEAPWPLARVCTEAGEVPCGRCDACRRWHEAFETVGIETPVQR